MDSFKQQVVFCILGLFLVEGWVVVCSILFDKKSFLDKEQNTLIIKPSYADYFWYGFLFYIMSLMIVVYLVEYIEYLNIVLAVFLSVFINSFIMFYSTVTYYFTDEGVKAYRNWDKKITSIKFNDILHVEPLFARERRYYRIRFFDIVKKRNRTIKVREESHSNDKILQEYFELNGVMYIRK